MVARKTPTQETLDAIRCQLHYEPVSGKLYRKISMGRGVRAGDEAGYIDAKTGYVRVKVNGIRLQAHNICWYLQTGEWPEFIVDHKDRVRHNNRWRNFRRATNAHNAQNAGGKVNSTGYRGVRAQPNGMYRAQIEANGRVYFSKQMNDPERAHAWYCRARQKLHGEFAGE